MDTQIEYKRRNRFKGMLKALLEVHVITSELLQECQRWGVSSRSFKKAIVFGASGTILGLLQFGLIYKMLNALILGRTDTILHGASGMIFQKAIPSWAQESDQMLWGALILFAVLTKSAEIYLSHRAEKFLFDAKIKIKNKLDEKILERTLNLNFAFFDTYWGTKRISQSNIIELINRKTEEYASLVSSAYQYYHSLLILFSAGLLLLLVQPKIFLLSIFVIPITRFIGTTVIESISGVLQQEREEKKNGMQRVSSLIQSLLLVKMGSKERAELDLFKLQQQEQQIEQDHNKKIELLEKPINGISKTLTILVLALFGSFGILFETKKKLSLLVVGVMIVQLMEGAIDHILQATKKLAKFREKQLELDYVCGSVAEPFLMSSGNIICPKFADSIEFRDLSFIYPNGRKAIEKLNLKIKKNKCLAIVGPTGSGKSTLFKLLMRLYPVQNESYFIDGVDVNQLELQSVRKNFSYVPQEPVWLQGTIRENLIYGAGRDVSDDEIEKLFRKLDLWKMIQKFPKKLETSMIVRGGAFSGGELQCLAIARALLKDAEIMILDEPTSSLDAFSEFAVQEILKQAMKDKTVILIAHRLSTVAQAETLVYWADGKILEQGSLQELLDKQGHFYSVWMKQGRFWLGEDEIAA